MDAVTTAIVPIVLFLALGAVLRRRVLTEPGFWRGLEWMSYRLFTPALFITSIAGADLTVVSPAPLLLSLVVPILTLSLFVLALRRLLRADGPRLTSLVQGTIRINTYIGLIFASALHGQEGVATFALASAIVVPLVNLVCVSALAVHGDTSERTRRLPLWRELLGNPLIQGCAVGLGLNLLGLDLPAFLDAALEMLAAPALVCGTVIAGAALRFALNGRDVLDIGLTSTFKLLLLPLAAMSIAIPLGVEGVTLTSIVLICAVPTSPSSYVLAVKMGGDARLMAAVTGVQTVLAVATVPALIALAHHVTP